jgi:hypothetical protein
MKTQWENCILHNFPIGFREIYIPPKALLKTFTSLYELQKSASSWNPSDFREVLQDRVQITHKELLQQYQD